MTWRYTYFSNVIVFHTIQHLSYLFHKCMECFDFCLSPISHSTADISLKRILCCKLIHQSSHNIAYYCCKMKDWYQILWDSHSFPLFPLQKTCWFLNELFRIHKVSKRFFIKLYLMNTIHGSFVGRKTCLAVFGWLIWISDNLIF